MESFARLRDLPLEVEGYALDGLSRATSSGFERRTTVVRLRGGGEEGLGEDVVYDAVDHEALQAAGPTLPLAGSWTLGSFCAHVGSLELFPARAARPVSLLYRRWAFESAALDLALRQARRSLAEALGRTPRPVRFVVSLRLPEPPSAEPLRRLLGRAPALRFKLDPTSSWDDALVEEIAALAAVDTVDLKGAYVGTRVDQAPDAALYARVANAFPEAWIEDPALTEETEAVLRPHRDRITWDAPIHSLADVEALPFAPRCLNVKPSRLGGLEALLALYDACEASGIALYGGGQFELGPGRGQVQHLASLFHPDAPNDVAPGGYNDPEPPAGLPEPPLPPPPPQPGFR